MRMTMSVVRAVDTATPRADGVVAVLQIVRQRLVFTGAIRVSRR
jgi:hypothetical protein